MSWFSSAKRYLSRFGSSARFAAKHVMASAVPGGAWGEDPDDCRVASRGWDLPSSRNSTSGFRLIFRVD